MTTVRLDAEITENGELKIQLPAGLPPGKVQVEISLPNTPLLDDEIRELLRHEPMTGAEIVAAGLTGGWKDLSISDGAAWVEEQRRKRREKRGW
jgi:hypothetical protein